MYLNCTEPFHNQTSSWITYRTTIRIKSTDTIKEACLIDRALEALRSDKSIIILWHEWFWIKYNLYITDYSFKWTKSSVRHNDVLKPSGYKIFPERTLIYLYLFIWQLYALTGINLLKIYSIRYMITTWVMVHGEVLG